MDRVAVLIPCYNEAKTIGKVIFGNSLVRGSINHLFKTSIKDIMTGYRAFSYQFVKSFPVLSKGLV